MESEVRRRVARVRHEVRRREVTVARVEPLGPGFVAVTFAGDEFEGFRSDGFDDHVKFVFTGPDGERVSRDYTPRRHDVARRELTVEFALHEAGEATAWARGATPGLRATIGGPKGSMVIDADHDWHLLVGDETALPAISRRLEELPGGRAIVIARADDPGDRRSLASAATLDVRWLGAGDDLADALAGFAPPPGEGFAWAAGEAGEMARVRDALVALGQPRHAMRVAAYWRREASGVHEMIESGVEAARDPG